MTPERIKENQNAMDTLRQENERGNYKKWLEEEQSLPCPREDGDLGLPVP